VVSFLFPEGLFFFLLLCPLFFGFAFFAWRHEKEVITAFLLKPAKKIFIVEAIALIVAALFISLSIARPVASSPEPARIKFADDTTVLMVFDVSLSMLAQKEPYGATRMERAKDMGLEIAKRLDARIGVAGFTNAMMVHLFPTKDRQAIREVIEGTVRAGSVPFTFSSTSGGSLYSIVKSSVGFFPQGSKHKIIIVFTDGDMPPLVHDDITDSFRRQQVVTFFVGVGAPEEFVYRYDSDGKLIGQDLSITNFRKDVLLESARVLGGKYFDEGEPIQIVNAVKNAVGPSVLEEVTEYRKAVELTPLTALLSFGAFMALFYIRRQN
jgi:hypothetical protein